MGREMQIETAVLPGPESSSIATVALPRAAAQLNPDDQHAFARLPVRILVAGGAGYVLWPHVYCRTRYGMRLLQDAAIGTLSRCAQVADTSLADHSASVKRHVLSGRR